jgi:hypothetical protein
VLSLRDPSVVSVDNFSMNRSCQFEWVEVSC